MNLKANFENHSVVFVLLIAAASFAAGWGAREAVQSAAGRISVSVETAKKIDLMDAERQAYIARIIQLEAEKKSIESDLTKAKAIAPSGETGIKTETLPPPRKALPSLQSKGQKKVEPSGDIPVTLGNISVANGPVQSVKTNTYISASLDYIVKPGYTVRLWLRPGGGNCAYLYDPSPEISGSGRITRTFTSISPCNLEELVVVAEHGEANSSKYLKTTRVNITFSQ